MSPIASFPVTPLYSRRGNCIAGRIKRLRKNYLKGEWQMLGQERSRKRLWKWWRRGGGEGEGDTTSITSESF